ncbi:hypothetical protein N8996_07050 [Candidatus Poseidonia alphae]|nr:hypothetical protein [Candidatus Poseidonia alphae]
MNEFQENIKKWVSTDSQIKILNDKIKDIKNEKQQLGESIFNFVETNNLSQSTIKISDGKLKFTQTKQTGPVTLGFLENTLGELFSEEQTNQIMDHIKSKREVKYSSEIKRYYNN